MARTCRNARSAENIVGWAEVGTAAGTSIESSDERAAEGEEDECGCEATRAGVAVGLGVVTNHCIGSPGTKGSTDTGPASSRGEYSSSPTGVNSNNVERRAAAGDWMRVHFLAYEPVPPVQLLRVDGTAELRISPTAPAVHSA